MLKIDKILINILLAYIIVSKCETNISTPNSSEIGLLRTLLTRFITLPFVSQILPTNLIEQLIDGILQYQQPIRSPPHTADTELIKKTISQQQLNVLQLLLRKLLSANLRYLPLKTITNIFADLPLISQLLSEIEAPLHFLHPYSSNLLHRIALFKQLRQNLRFRLSHENDTDIKTGITNTLNDVDRELQKHDDSDNLNKDGIIGYLLKGGD